jgi:type II secretory ATPase GspE/PulE/Tfp pilus assembly ATPase PilB-like protein
MGVEPYLVASALKGVLAQRLVRRNCSRCTEPIEIDEKLYPPEVIERIRRQGVQIQQGKGCRTCKDSGYRGRVALHELLVVDEEIERAIVQGIPTVALRNLARRNGMNDLFDDGLSKAQEGQTSLEQVMLATRMSEEEDAGPAVVFEPSTMGTPAPEDTDLSLEDEIVEVLSGPEAS